AGGERGPQSVEPAVTHRSRPGTHNRAAEAVRVGGEEAGGEQGIGPDFFWRFGISGRTLSL
ncbi:hypothetical protein, partial [Methylobacterium sp. WL18]|uniref:hypothetical protein n=1 Tax=Methylobacterium sp. WL18 TaxID=2603897 RepID=UPI001AEF3091